MTRKRRGQTSIEEPTKQDNPNGNDRTEYNGTSENMTQNDSDEAQKQKRTHRGRRKGNQINKLENSSNRVDNNNSVKTTNNEIIKTDDSRKTDKIINGNCCNRNKDVKDISQNTELPKSNQKNNSMNLLAQLLQQNLALPPLNPEEDDEEEMEDCVEYKFKPRPVFLANVCNYCKRVESTDDEVKLTPCSQCKMVNYCCIGHRKYDLSHHEFCAIICTLRNSTGTQHLYQDARGLSMEDFRQMRIQIMVMCQSISGRPLEPNEREILLFPRLCNAPQCREWRTDKLTNCPKCQQVSYCVDNSNHLSRNHATWCNSFKLFHQITARIFKDGTIEPELPERIFTEQYALTKNINDCFLEIYENACEVYDECEMAVLSLMATAPLSTLYAMQKVNRAAFKDTLNIHVVGAELQFEADTLNKWETFFLHLVPEIKNLRITFIGPELNIEDLPVDELSKIGLCKSCQTSKRVINFEFQCRKLYHDYAASGQFSTPDIVCAFNAGLHRVAGYAGQDTWPKTIAAILKSNVPFIITAYTEHEAPLDLKRIHESAGRTVEVLEKPHVNPYASLKPDRNFISEESAPFIFKNFYITVVK